MVNNNKVLQLILCSLLINLYGSPVVADVVFDDDLIVVGSTCVGNDCRTTGMVFNEDTFVFSENNLRILFTDSTTPGSPAVNNWKIQINDAANEGKSYFSFIDVETAADALLIEAGASANNLFLNDKGKVGINTDNPSHVLNVEGDSLVTGVVELSSSRSLKSNIRRVDSENASATLAALQPVSYQYTSAPGEDRLGFIAEDVPELVATQSRKSLGTMDIVAVLTKVVQDQQLIIKELEDSVTKLKKQFGTK